MFVINWYNKGGNNLKSTGIVRQIDELGRIVLPKELRKNLEIKPKEPLEIFVDGDMIVLKKYVPACTFCGQTEGIQPFKNKYICPKCKEELKY
jgi:transcriptional pleiotropic regulator of transition state genes